MQGSNRTPVSSSVFFIKKETKQQQNINTGNRTRDVKVKVLMLTL